MTEPTPGGSAVAAGGATPWSELVGCVLAGHTCLWQDLDGLHVEAAPLELPPTSILWGWTTAGAMVRVRLDGDRGYAATCPAGVATSQTLTWVPTDQRVRAVTLAGTSGAGLELQLEEYVDDGLATGTGPVTFLRERSS